MRWDAMVWNYGMEKYETMWLATNGASDVTTLQKYLDHVEFGVQYLKQMLEHR